MILRIYYGKIAISSSYMKYRFLLQFLRFLMYCKRAIWWIGGRFYLILAKILGFFTRGIIFVQYKSSYFLRRLGIDRQGAWLLKRGFLQALLFLLFFGLTITETRLVTRQNLAAAAQHTQMNQLLGSEEEVQVDEISDQGYVVNSIPTWKLGSIQTVGIDNGTDDLAASATDIAGIMAGGSALGAPIILPGSSNAGHTRTDVEQYTVRPGDSLSSIAYSFGVSILTVLWENSLTDRSIIKPGQILRIPPGNGVMYTIQKGDNLKKIATKFAAATDDIVEFNQLRPDGTDLVKGQRIFIPNGVKPAEPKPVVVPRKNVFQSLVAKGSVIAPSAGSASLSGFIWPSAAHTVTQYFNSKHHAMDIAGPWQSPTYAVQSGIVEKAQCGWNGGYGCYVEIDHGNGIKSLYGHHSALLVNVGDSVQRGQVIALMGNTGNVRGLTGIHLHFEVIVNGVRVNPLGYIR